MHCEQCGRAVKRWKTLQGLPRHTSCHVAELFNVSANRICLPDASTRRRGVYLETLAAHNDGWIGQRLTRCSACRCPPPANSACAPPRRKLCDRMSTTILISSSYAVAVYEATRRSRLPVTSDVTKLVKIRIRRMRILTLKIRRMLMRIDTFNLSVSDGRYRLMHWLRSVK